MTALPVVLTAQDDYTPAGKMIIMSKAVLEHLKINRRLFTASEHAIYRTQNEGLASQMSL